MKITNHHGLPKTFQNAIERDDYTMGDARISVTGLLKPPRIGLLFQKYSNLIEKDVVDYIWQLQGRAMHKILEQGGDEHHLPEERLYTEIRGWRISGAADLQIKQPGVAKITDYKNTSSYAVMHGKDEWEQQLNCYRYLVEVNKFYSVDELAVCAIVRDWTRHQARLNPLYPVHPCVMIPVRVWSMDEAHAFLEERVKVHQQAIADRDLGDEPPLCSDEERWMRKPRYAVVKAGSKRASRVFDEAHEAADYVAVRGGGGFTVETRDAEPIRCTGDYCNVSRWCKQYQQWKAENP